MSCSSKQEEKDAFCSFAEAWVVLALFEKPEEREFVVESGAPMHMLSKKDVSSGELDTLRKSRNTTKVITDSGEMSTRGEAQVFVHDF